MASKLTLPYQIVDAFATGPFTGNQAGVLVLASALSDTLMQQIAAELNLAETAYLLPLTDRGAGTFSLRWFTPVAEERLCGHATLASAHILSYLGIAPGPDGVYHFQTRWSGELTARVREGGQIELDFPADDLTSLEGEEKQKIVSAVGRALPEDAAFDVENVWRGNLDVIVALSPRDGSQLREAKINIDELDGLSSRGVILTSVLATANDAADANTSQVHSRALFPGIIGEDTVTGSAHCSLAILHSPRFGGPGAEVRCTQGFGPHRTGALRVVWDGKAGKAGGRVKLRGDACVVAEGRLLL